MSLSTRFARNYSYLASSRGSSIIVNIIFLAAASRYLSLIDFGKLVFILATTSFLQMCFAGGLDSILVREQCQRPDARSAHFCNSLPPILCTALAVASISMVVAFFYRSDRTIAEGMVLAGLASSFNLTLSVPIAFYRAAEKMHFEASLVAFERILFLIGSIAVFLSGGGVVGVAACLMCSVGLKGFAGYYMFLRQFHGSWSTPDRTGIWYFLLESAPMMLASLLFALRWRLDLFLLKAWGTDAQVGMYGAAFRLGDMMKVLPVDVVSAVFPIFCKTANEGEGNFAKVYHAIVKWSLVLGLLCGVVLFAYADQLIPLLFSSRYASAITPFRILLIAYPLMFWSMANSVTLTSLHRQVYIAYGLVLALIVQTVVDFVGIHRWGIVGASSGYVSGEIAFFLTVTFAVLPVMADFRRSLSVALRLFLAGAVVLLADASGLWHSMLIGVPVSATLYLLMLRLLAVVTPNDVKALSSFRWPRAWRISRGALENEVALRAK